ncbi:MAG: DNA translocase FtsK, partial [Planctomycetota bacterium]
MYNFPPIDFLEDPPRVDHAEGREELDRTAQKIEDTLASFRLEAKVHSVQRGPVITQYEVSLAPGIKVHKIVSLSDDLAMALEARSVRVVAPIPGKSTVGIEVPNQRREVVALKELLRQRALAEDAALPLFLGKDAAGDTIIEDLGRMPHLLVAGATGSGKSVCVNAIIASMLMTRSPEDLKMILIDPKMVELSVFEEIPHLLTPVITDMKKAPAALDWLVRKMDQRYEILSKAGVRHIKDYNALGKKELYERLTEKMSHEEADEAPEHLPYIVVIVDEFADLMMTAAKEVENHITR